MSNIIISNLGPSVSSQFSELRVASRTPVLELTSVYGVSALRDIVTTSGSGSVTNTATEYQLTTTASGADSAILDSAARGRYEPGFAGEGGVGVRLPSAPAGSQVARWGIFDDQNGLYFGANSTSPFIGIRRAGVDTVVPQASWNVDPLNGTGPSGVTLNLASGNVFQILFTWYGYGVIEFRVVTEAAPTSSPQQVITVHRYVPSNQTSVVDPDLPLRAEVNNGGTAAALTLFVGGRQYSVVGRYDPVFRVTSEKRTLTGIPVGATTPSISFRRKAVFPIGSARSNSVRISLQSMEVISTVDLAYQVILGGILTGGSFGAVPGVPAGETALDVNTGVTAISGGEVIFQGLASGGMGDTRTLAMQEVLGFTLPTNQTVTLAVVNVGGSGSNTAYTLFGLVENW